MTAAAPKKDLEAIFGKKKGGKKKKKKKKEELDTDIPTEVPTQKDTVMNTVLPTSSLTVRKSDSDQNCDLRPRDEAFMESLTLISPAEELTSRKTDQGSAFEWIVVEDLALVNPCTYPTVEQRYVLATIYFSTKQYGWSKESNWLSIAPECEWDGVECAGGGDNATLVTRLHLAYTDLPGHFPNEIKALKALETLEVTADTISGGPPIVFNMPPRLNNYNVRPRSTTNAPVVTKSPTIGSGGEADMDKFTNSISSGESRSAFLFTGILVSLFTAACLTLL